ncbi:MAG TPA: hypothetical protein VID47_17100 [Actinomycetota bacterium]|jgi:hypothetical protein
MRNRHLLAIVAALVALALALAACGGDEDKDKDADADAGSSPLATCTGPAVAQTGLPADFPVPSGVTFTKTASAGPSTIVDGYAKGDVESVYNAWKQAFDQAKYTLTSTDFEAPDDAELNFASADGKTTGQAAMRNQCGGDGTIAVHVVDRPE